jgi:hypothetical protein
MKLSIALLIAAVFAPACAAPRATQLSFEDQERLEVRRERDLTHLSRPDAVKRDAVAARTSK